MKAQIALIAGGVAIAAVLAAAPVHAQPTQCSFTQRPGLGNGDYTVTTKCYGTQTGNLATVTICDYSAMSGYGSCRSSTCTYNMGCRPDYIPH
jgi:hypothetical protein